MVYRAILDESFLNLEMIQVAQNIKGKDILDLRKLLLEGDILDYSSQNNLKRKLGEKTGE